MKQQYRFHRIFLLAVMTGPIIGLLIGAFYWIIPLLTALLITLPLPPIISYLFPLSLGSLVMGGILLVAPRTGGPGIGDAVQILINERGDEKWYLMPLKWVATIICTVTGGGGLVGPSVFISTTSGILFGKRFQLNSDERQLLALAGMAGGAGAVLRAPIGGVLIMIEAFIGNHWKQKTNILYIIVFSLVTSFGSYLTVGMLTGFSPILYLKAEAPPLLSITVIWSVIGGIVGGFGAKIFIETFKTVKRIFERFLVPLWLKPLIGALLAGGIVIIFSTGHTSALQPFEIGRMGLAPLQDALVGKLGLSIVVMMICGKLLDVTIRSGSGNSVGVFGPAMWIGGLTGALIGFLPNCDQTVVPIVSGIAAGITTAMGFPLAASIIIIEIFGLAWIETGIIGCITGVLSLWVWKKSGLGK